jgi:hypothetical protein
MKNQPQARTRNSKSPAKSQSRKPAPPAPAAPGPTEAAPVPLLFSLTEIHDTLNRSIALMDEMIKGVDTDEGSTTDVATLTNLAFGLRCVRCALRGEPPPAPAPASASEPYKCDAHDDLEYVVIETNAVIALLAEKLSSYCKEIEIQDGDILECGFNIIANNAREKLQSSFDATYSEFCDIRRIVDGSFAVAAPVEGGAS